MAQRPLTPKELSGLYPNPKSYEQKLAEREALNKIREQNRPKFPITTITLLPLIILVAVYVATLITPSLLASGGLASVSLSFGIGLIVFFIARIVLASMTDIIERSGWSAQAFYIGYFLIMSIAVAAVYWLLMLSFPAKALCLGIVHILLVQFLLRALAK